MVLYDLITDLLYENPKGMMANDIARNLELPWSDVNSVLRSYNGITFEKVPGTYLWRLTQSEIKKRLPGLAKKQNNTSPKKVIGRDILNLLNEAPDGMSIGDIAYQLKADENEIKSVINNLDNICHYNVRTDKWSLQTDEPEIEYFSEEEDIPFSDVDKRFDSAKRDSSSLKMPTNEDDAKAWIKRYPQRVIFFKNNGYYRVYDENAVVLARVDSRLDFIANNRFIDVKLPMYSSTIDVLKKYHVNAMTIDKGEIISQIVNEYDNSYISFFAISQKTSAAIKSKISRRDSKMGNMRKGISKKQEEILRIAKWNDENLYRD